MPTAREIDDNGFLLVKGCPISSFGIFDYGAGQLGLDGDPNRIVKVFRPESAVSDQAAIQSFMNVPFINDHEMLSGFEGDESTSAPEDYGISGVLTSNIYYESPWMRGDLKIFSRDVQQDLAKGKKDLSLGYSCDFEVKPGVFDGQAYEVVQTNLRGNHIALVDEGRVPGARVLDGLCFDHLRFDVRPSDKEHVMKTKAGSKAVADNAVAQLKALLSALEQYLGEEANEPAHQDQGAGGEIDPAAPQAEAAPANPAEAAPAEAATEPQAGGEGDVAELIKNVEAVLAQLKSLTGGAGADAGGGNAPDEAEDEVDPEMAPVTDEEESGQGSAPAGPEAGKHAMAGDAAVINRFYADLAKKHSTYERLSKVVGAFDHATMDSKQINAYGVKKLGIKCSVGQEHVALDAYLNGVESAQKATKTTIQVRAADSAKATTELDSYLKGK